MGRNSFKMKLKFNFKIEVSYQNRKFQSRDLKRRAEGDEDSVRRFLTSSSAPRPQEPCPNVCPSCKGQSQDRLHHGLSNAETSHPSWVWPRNENLPMERRDMNPSPAEVITITSSASGAGRLSNSRMKRSKPSRTALLSAYRFKIFHHRMELYGRCGECGVKKGTAKKKG